MTNCGPIPMSHPHVGLRDRLVALVGGQQPPVFEPVDGGEPEGLVLRAVAALAAETGLRELDVNREPVAHRWSGFATAWHCSVRGVGSDGSVERFCANWSPVGRHDDPRTGFGDGPDSAVLGHSGRTVMPDDWRTDALLMVVTTPFVHLSADRRGDPPRVQGVTEQGLTGHRFVELTPHGAVPGPDAPVCAPGHTAGTGDAGRG